MQTKPDTAANGLETYRHTYQLLGTSQGLGLRPHIFRLAQRLSLAGFVRNEPTGAEIVVEGQRKKLELFEHLLAKFVCLGPHKLTVNVSEETARGLEGFHIARSRQPSLGHWTSLEADQGLCQLCSSELLDPKNRRYFYPFMACAECGPRFAITQDTPFDRAQTSYQNYPLCAACQSEYRNPNDRRFHAQTISCPHCGPTLSLVNADHRLLCSGSPKDLLKKCATLLNEGNLIAVKSLHGFQLWAKATNKQAILALRKAKNRPQKPFAIMFPSTGAIEKICLLSKTAKAALTGPQRPIVLLKIRPTLEKMQPPLPLAHLCPGLNQLGCMLPTSALHQLCLEIFDFPIIVTSGNRPGEPIEGATQKAIKHLASMAQAFVVHGLEIKNPIDDSVVQCCHGNIQVIRRARGFVPKPLPLQFKTTNTDAIALGGEEKISFAQHTPAGIFLSAPLSTLSTLSAQQRFNDQLHQVRKSQSSVQYGCDLHPDYLTTHLAEGLALAQGNTPLKVQHHHSHFLATLNEYGITQESALGFIWDGYGLGLDGNAWGGECFLFDHKQPWPIERVASLVPFQLPGSDAASRCGWRVGLSLIATLRQDKLINQTHFNHLIHQLTHRHPQVEQLLHCLESPGAKQNPALPYTSSIGRLFDGISALLGLCEENTYQGEAALKLMSAAKPLVTTKTPCNYYRFTFRQETELVMVEWKNVVSKLIKDYFDHLGIETIAYQFHRGLAELCADLIEHFAQQYAFKSVVFSGGVWQNGCLVNLTQAAIKHRRALTGVNFCLAKNAPANDSGLAVGQLIALGIKAAGHPKKGNSNNT